MEKASESNGGIGKELRVCEQHGEYESRNLFRTIWSRCPRCTAAEDAAEHVANIERERQEKIQRWERTIGESGIPDRFQDRSFDNYTTETDGEKRALLFAMDYAQRFSECRRSGRSAIFCGRPGTGKTHLAAAIGLHLLRQGNAVLFQTVFRAVRRVKDTWSRGSAESESQAVAGLVFPDLLILDEVGVQFGSDAERVILFDILNERYERMKPTLLLSNLPLAGVKDFLGERIFDRMREGDGAYIPFDWESRRGSV
jgi:DNA replication protein DnaC